MIIRIAGRVMAPRRLLSAAVGIVLVVGVMVAGVAPSSPASAATGNRAPFVIGDGQFSSNTVMLKCLAIAYDPATISYYATGVDCAPDTSGRGAQWYVTPVASAAGYVQLESVSLAGFCIEDLGTTGGTAWLRRCDTANPGQLWLVDGANRVSYQNERTGRYLSAGYYYVGLTTSYRASLLVPAGSALVQIRSEYSDKCVDVDNNPGSTKVQQWTCLGSAQLNQLFHVMATGWASSDGYPVYFSPRHTSGDAIQWGCISADCSADRTPLTNGGLMGMLDAMWYLRFAEWQPDGLLFTLVSWSYDKCADLRVEGAGHSDGTVIQGWQCLGNGQRNQLWHITVP